MDKRELKELNLEYLEKIDAPNFPFGIEIEFEKALYSKVEYELYKLFPTKISLELWKNSKKKPDYGKWALALDASVQEYLGYGKYEGGEINSPILHNNKKSWIELKQVCEMLKQIENLKITGNCGLHIHVDKKSLPTTKEKINLLKMYIVYEDIINKFSYGLKNEPRILLYKFARPFGQDPKIMEIINELDKIETDEELTKLFKKDRRYGLNVINIVNNDKPTLEKRVSNGTTNKRIIQNDVRMTLNLFNYARKENFDEEYINYKLKNYEPIFLNKSIFDDEEKASDFANRIYKNELSKQYFYKQYYKEYNDYDIEKTNTL